VKNGRGSASGLFFEKKKKKEKKKRKRQWTKRKESTKGTESKAQVTFTASEAVTQLPGKRGRAEHRKKQKYAPHARNTENDSECTQQKNAGAL